MILSCDSISVAICFTRIVTSIVKWRQTYTCVAIKVVVVECSILSASV